MHVLYLFPLSIALVHFWLGISAVLLRRELCLMQLLEEKRYPIRPFKYSQNDLWKLAVDQWQSLEKKLGVVLAGSVYFNLQTDLLPCATIAVWYLHVQKPKLCIFSWHGDFPE